MEPTPARVLLAKIGLDGHDRGVKVLARSFRDAGIEVIYTGLWQTPAGTAKAAVEEDVDVLGASFHSAAHMTLVPVLMDELRRRGRPDMPVVIGGIIPHDEVSIMRQAGVAGIYEPEDSLERIIAEVKSLAAQAQQTRRAAWKGGELKRWTAAARQGDRTALGRVLTWTESVPAEDEVGQHFDVSAGAGTEVGARKNSRTSEGALLKSSGTGESTLLKSSGTALVIGVTGAPGVGKSTLIGRLAKELAGRGKQVAVVAVDPASPITGGALLGDRARMSLAAEEPNVFLRSSASRGQLGGLAPSTGLMVQALMQSKVDVLIVETVGAGQSDIAVRQWAKPLILVMMPGAGDDLQLAKAGITEVADVFVINKADLPGAERLQAQIRETLGSKRPVVQTVASHGKGIAELADALLK